MKILSVQDGKPRGRSALHAVACGAWGLLCLALLLPASARAEEKADPVPVVDAGRGPCSVDFRVTDSNKQPLFNATVYVKIKYGFLGLRRMELEVGTNADGRARVTGLSSKTRKEPLSFRVWYHDAAKTVLHYPAVDCNEHYDVTLDTKAASPAPPTGD
jgi:hypothetical protein